MYNAYIQVTLTTKYTFKSESQHKSLTRKTQHPDMRFDTLHHISMLQSKLAPLGTPWSSPVCHVIGRGFSIIAQTAVPISMVDTGCLEESLLTRLSQHNT